MSDTVRYTVRNNTSGKSLGKTVELLVNDPSTTLTQLKELIAEKVFLVPDLFELYFGNDNLVPDEDVPACDFFNNRPAVSLWIKRPQELEGEEHDDKYKSSNARRTTRPVPIDPRGDLPAPVSRPMSLLNTYSSSFSSTGYRGLSNQGATCYMNSLIQSLFMTPEFRVAVYSWNFTEHLHRRVEKLKAEASANGYGSTPATPNAANKDENKKEEDLSWLPSADQLLNLWTRVELEGRTAALGEDSSMSSEEDSTTAPSANSGTTSPSNPSATPAPSTSDSEEAYESKFVKEARALGPAIHAHAKAFEIWKKSVESRSIPFQLRLLFAKLQISEERALKTKGLTKSFGWTSADAFTQHDVQELLRVLFDALEKAWEGTPQHSLINDLYQGEVLDYVKCSVCGNKSSRTDKYLDLQLTVKPFGSATAMRSIEEALEKYVQPETLNGDNQYFCSKCNQKQDATKGLEFAKFPYLLTLQLKRFDFDWEHERRIKLTDRVTFPLTLNLNHFLAKDENSLQQPSHPLDSLLTQLSAFNLPEGYKVRYAKNMDHDEIISVVKDAFGADSVEGNIVHQLISTLSSPKHISIVITKDNYVVGHVLASPVHVFEGGDCYISFEKDKTSKTTPYVAANFAQAHLSQVPALMGIAPVAVLKSQQNKGIGKALMRAVIENAISRNVHALVVLGHPQYYHKFGFVPADRFGLYFSDKVPSNACMALELFDGVLAQRRLVSARVVYDPIFYAAEHQAQVSSLLNQVTANNMDVGDDPSALGAVQSTSNSSPRGLSPFNIIHTITKNAQAQVDGPSIYELFAISIHRGSAQGGHYYAYVREFTTGDWFEFNDSSVTRASQAQVESSFGDSSAYSTAGTAYMLLYRQRDPKRNMLYPSNDAIPSEVTEAVTIEKRRKEAKEALKRIEAAKMSISVRFRGSSKEIRLHRDQTVLDAIKMAANVYGVSIPLEDIRFHSTSSFLRADDPSVFHVTLPLRAFSSDAISQVQLQTRLPGTDFKPFDPKSALYLVYVWDANANSWPAESFEVYLPPRPTLGHLQRYIAQEFGIPIELQIITKPKNTATPVEEVKGDPDRSLTLFSLWEKADIYVEPFTADLFDPTYRPSRRRKIGTGSTTYSASKTTTSSVRTNYERAANARTVENATHDKSNQSTFTTKSITSDPDEMNLAPIGMDDLASSSDEEEQPTEADMEVSSTGATTEDPKDDDGYEYFHDPRFIIRDGKRVIPRSEDLVRNIQNRIVVRFTNVDGLIYINAVTMNKHDSVNVLRNKIADKLNVDPHSFIILKSTLATELNDGNDEIGLYTYGSIVSLLIKKGTPSLNGESLLRFEPWVLPGKAGMGTPDSNANAQTFEPFEAFLCPEKLYVKQAKEHVRRLGKLEDIPADRIRLRKYGYDGHPSMIGLDHHRLSLLGAKIYVQILDEPERKTAENERVVNLRQVFPDTFEFDAVTEICLPSGATYADILERCKELAGTPRLSLCIRPIYNLPQLSEMDRADWLSFTSRLDRPVALMTNDGDYFYFRETDTPFKTITEEERRKLPKYRAKTSFAYRAERALSIKVDNE